MSKKKPAKPTAAEKAVDVQADYPAILRRLYASEVEIERLKDRLDKLEAATKSWRWWE